MPNIFGSPLCEGLDKPTIGNRVYWAKCGRLHNHDGDHYDGKRKHKWSGPVFYWDEIDWTAPDKIVKPKRVRKKAEVRDILVRRGVKHDVLAQHHEEQKWRFLERTAARAPVEQFALNINPDDPDAYYGAF